MFEIMNNMSDNAIGIRMVAFDCLMDGKNGADCYSKNGHAVTVLTRQSYCFFLKLSPFNANLAAVFTTLSKMAYAAETAAYQRLRWLYLCAGVL